MEFRTLDGDSMSQGKCLVSEETMALEAVPLALCGSVFMGMCQRELDRRKYPESCRA